MSAGKPESNATVKARTKPDFWSHMGAGHYGLLSTMCRQLHTQIRRDPDLLPVIDDDTLFVFSDYGGEHNTSQFHTISILAVDLPRSAQAIRNMQDVRHRLLRDSRRIGFKELNDRRCTDAFFGFLDASDALHGLCITFAVSKTIRNLVDGDWGAADKQLWKPGAYDRVMRISAFVSLVTAMLARPGQNVTWISDQDAVAANDRQLRRLTGIFGHIVSLLVPHSLGHLRVGTTRVDNGTRQVEDLAAVADLAAGCSAEVLTAMQTSGTLGSRIMAPTPQSLSTKSHYLVGWFARHTSLRKLLCYVRRDDRGQQHLGWLGLQSEPRILLPESTHAQLLRGTHKNTR